MKSETELLQAVLEARRKVNELGTLLAEAGRLKLNAERALLEYMEDRDLKSFRSSTLNCTVIHKEILYVSIDIEKRAEAFRWISEDCGRSDMIKHTIHHKTLTSFISERLKSGEQIPQDIFRYFFQPELTIRIKKEG